VGGAVDNQEEAVGSPAERSVPWLVRPAADTQELAAAAALRAVAFYDELAGRQALPFPPRFRSSFEREFAQRVRSSVATVAARCCSLVPDAPGQELHSLLLRTRGAVGASLACFCLLAPCADISVCDVPPSFAGGDDGRWPAFGDATPGLLGCADVSLKAGPCSCSAAGECVAEGVPFAYLDNVVVTPEHRRSGVGAALLGAASAAAAALPGQATELLTHVHVRNDAARALYRRWGFEALPLAQSRQPLMARAASRLVGLQLLRAPLPLRRSPRGPRDAAGTLLGECRCGARDWGLLCVC